MKTTAKKALYSLVALSLIFGLAEALFRLLGPPAPDLSRAITLFPAHDSREVRSGFLTFQGDTVATNELLLPEVLANQPPAARHRVQRFKATAAPGTLRVAFMGGSTTQGYRISDPYPEQVQSLLRGRGIKVEVLNAGVVSFESGRLLPLLPLVLSGFKPQVLVVEVPHNEGLDVPQNLLVSRPRPALTSVLVGMLERSRLFRHLESRGLHGRPEVIADGPGAVTDLVRRRWYAQAVQRIGQRLQTHLGIFRASCERQGVKLVLMTGPYCTACTVGMQDFLLYAYGAGVSQDEVAVMKQLFSEVRAHLGDPDPSFAERTLEEVTDRTHGLYWGLKGHLLARQGRIREAGQCFEMGASLVWLPMGSVFNGVISDWGSANQIPVVDAHGALKRRGNGWFSDPAFFHHGNEEDFIHPTSAGHRVIAGEVVATLERLGVVPQAQ